MAESRLDRIEAEAVEAAVGAWSRDVEKLKVATLALYSARGRLTGEELRALLGKVRLPSGADLTPALLAAAKVGDTVIEAKTAVHSSQVAASVAAGVKAKPAEALTIAKRRSAIATVTNLADVLTVLAPLTGSVAAMRGDVEFAVMRSRNEAVVSAAAQVGEKVVFVPERDACLECTGRAGDTGEAATADPPPLHPHCRCELDTYDDEEVPRALQREAVRSVLRGFSLPSESEAARLRAAKAALRGKPVAPQSVQDYAARAIRDGKFPRGRNLP